MTRDVLNSHRTAIGRSRVSAPVRYLLERNLIRGLTLDYGCGRGFDTDYLDHDAWDPYWRPGALTRAYDTILCSYVLNTLIKKHESGILAHIKGLLAKKGVAYITVRRNVRTGYTSKGTHQRNVILDLPVVTKNSDYAIYSLTSEGKRDKMGV